MGVGDLNIEWSCRKTGVEGGYKIPEAFRLRINVSVNLSQQNFSTICISCWLAIVSCTQKDYFMVVLRDVKGDVFDQKMEEEYFFTVHTAPVHTGNKSCRAGKCGGELFGFKVHSCSSELSY